MAECIRFIPVRSKSLRGYADFRMASGHVYHGCPVFETPDGLSVGLPKAPVVKHGMGVTTEDGSPLYVPVITIPDPDDYARFQQIALCELLAYLDGKPSPGRLLEELICEDRDE